MYHSCTSSLFPKLSSIALLLPLVYMRWPVQTGYDTRDTASHPFVLFSHYRFVLLVLMLRGIVRTCVTYSLRFFYIRCTLWKTYGRDVSCSGWTNASSSGSNPGPPGCQFKIIVNILLADGARRHTGYVAVEVSGLHPVPLPIP